MIIRAVLGAAEFDVVPESIQHLSGQGKLPSSARFAQSDIQSSVLPVNILQPQAHHLSTTQPKVEHAQGHGVVAFSFWGCSSETVQEFASLLLGQNLGPAWTSRSHFRNGRCKLWPTSSFEVDESQESSDIAQSRLACNRRDSTNIVTRKTPDVRRLQQRPIGLPGAELPLHESLRVRFVKVQS